jgi:hypothetical protein
VNKSYSAVLIDSISQPEMLYHSIEKRIYRILNKYSHSSAIVVVDCCAFNSIKLKTSSERSFNFHFILLMLLRIVLKKELFISQVTTKERFNGIYDNLNTFFSASKTSTFVVFLTLFFSRGNGEEKKIKSDLSLFETQQTDATLFRSERLQQKKRAVKSRTIKV